MLEFNQEHKAADLSAIKEKTNKSKRAGKIMLCGVALSAVLLLSGCQNTTSNDLQSEITSSAIIMENGNAMIVDLQNYTHRNGSNVWTLTTTSGDRLYADTDSVNVIDADEESHEKAELVAQNLIGENGTITFYDDTKIVNKTK